MSACALTLQYPEIKHNADTGKNYYKGCAYECINVFDFYSDFQYMIYGEMKTVAQTRDFFGVGYVEVYISPMDTEENFLKSFYQDYLYIKESVKRPPNNYMECPFSKFVSNMEELIFRKSYEVKEIVLTGINYPIVLNDMVEKVDEIPEDPSKKVGSFGGIPEGYPYLVTTSSIKISLCFNDIYIYKYCSPKPKYYVVKEEYKDIFLQILEQTEVPPKV